MFDAQSKFDKESKKLEKKLLTTERNIATKLKLYKSKQQQSSAMDETLQASQMNQLKQSKTSSNSTITQD